MRIFLTYVLFAILLGWEPAETAWGQGAAPPPDMDYFTAQENPETYRDLKIIEHAHIGKVLYWLRTERMEMVMHELNFTLHHFPNHPQALLLTEMAADVTRVPALAITYYERAILLYPEYGTTHAQFGKYLVSIGRVSDGIGQLKEAVQRDPKLGQGYLWLGEAYAKAGKKELAQEAYAKARALGFTGGSIIDRATPDRKN